MAADDSTRLYRHPSDVARLTFALGALAVLVLIARLQDDELAGVSTDLLTLVDGLPSALVNGLVGLVQLLALLAPTVALIVLVRARLWQLMFLMALAAGLAGVTLVLLSEVVNSSVPVADLGFDRVDSWFIGSQFPSSTYLGMLTALLVAASPWLTTSWRRTGWIFIVFVMVARVLSSVEVPVRNLLLLAVGAAAGSLALVVFGAPRRRVDVSSVRESLNRAGIDADDVETRPGPTRVPAFSARTSDGRRLFVKVIGRDQRDSDLLLRTWRSLTLKGLGGGVPASPRRAVEHEALALGLLGAITPTPAPVGVLETEDEAAVLVTTYADGTPLSDLENVSDELLDTTWSAVARLQERRMAHGALDATNVLVDDDQVSLVDLGRADLRASDEALGADVAELLASLTLLVGVERAVDSAAAQLPTEVLERAVPLLQKAVLSAPSRRRYKDDDELLDTLRDRAASAAGIDTVVLAPVRRITIGGAVSLVGSLVLMGYVFNLAANWDQTWDAFTSADLVYAIPVILMMVSTYFSGAMSLIGAVTIDLVYSRTVAVMFGQSYLNRFTPANAGGMAMRVRYLQLNGLDTAVSASAVALDVGRERRGAGGHDRRVPDLGWFQRQAERFRVPRHRHDRGRHPRARADRLAVHDHPLRQDGHPPVGDLRTVQGPRVDRRPAGASEQIGTAVRRSAARQAGQRGRLLGEHARVRRRHLLPQGRCDVHHRHHDRLGRADARRCGRCRSRAHGGADRLRRRQRHRSRDRALLPDPHLLAADGSRLRLLPLHAGEGHRLIDARREHDRGHIVRVTRAALWIAPWIESVPFALPIRCTVNPASECSSVRCVASSSLRS